MSRVLFKSYKYFKENLSYVLTSLLSVSSANKDVKRIRKRKYVS